MANKDFFDEEYDKIESEQTKAQEEQTDNWYRRQPPVQSERVQSKKPLYVTLICVALVLCIIFGWVMCVVFGAGRSNEEQILSQVLSVLNNDYYKKVDDAAMWSGIEEAGTALLQNAGDKFSRLMSPATYYNYNHPQSSIGSGNGEVFGMSFQIVEGIGLYVSEVTVNSNSYGVLESGDLIVKISNLNDGQGVIVNNARINEINLSDASSALIQQILLLTDSAEFSVLRDGEIFSNRIARGKLGYVNADYPFEFVEFYFGDDCTNVSLTHGSTGPQTSVKEQRMLELLSTIPDAGYVRIDQFMDTNTDSGFATAAEEFAEVMQLFKSEIKDEDGKVIKKPLKYLILDLKGNPGGNVMYVSEIAGRLITDSKLSAAQQRSLRNKSGELLITTLETRSMGNQGYFAKSYYEDYFGEAADKPNIVVWTDGGSASASELLTGALRDYGTAVQMGVTTYGKGIAQTIKELEDYKGTFIVNGKSVTECWAVYFTVAEYFSPVTHTNIHGIGYTPETRYDGLDTYEKLWQATADYFNSDSSGIGGGILAYK